MRNEPWREARLKSSISTSRAIGWCMGMHAVLNAEHLRDTWITPLDVYKAIPMFPSCSCKGRGTWREHICCHGSRCIAAELRPWTSAPTLVRWGTPCWRPGCVSPWLSVLSVLSPGTGWVPLARQSDHSCHTGCGRGVTDFQCLKSMVAFCPPP